MTIGINLLNYKVTLAGNGTFAKRVIAQLQRLDKRNKYILYFNDIEGIEKVFNIYSPNFQIRKINLSNRIARIKFEATAFNRILKNDNIEVYYSPSLVVPANLKCNKIVCTIHDLSPFYINKYSKIRLLYYKIMSKLSVGKANHIITVSKNSKEDIVKLLNCDSNKINIVYNFLDDSDCTINNDYENFFLFVGTIQPGKNIIRMIQAFERFYNEVDSRFKLKIAGKKGWKDKKIQTYLENENIEVLGYVTDDDLDLLYSKSFSLLYPSLYEGFGIPPLESMRHGCPVIVSDISSIPEVVGEFGIYVDPYSVDSIFSGMKQMYYERNKYVNGIFEQSLKFNGKHEVIKLLKILDNENEWL